MNCSTFSIASSATRRRQTGTRRPVENISRKPFSQVVEPDPERDRVRGDKPRLGGPRDARTRGLAFRGVPLRSPPVGDDPGTEEPENQADGEQAWMAPGVPGELYRLLGHVREQEQEDPYRETHQERPRALGHPLEHREGDEPRVHGEESGDESEKAGVEKVGHRNPTRAPRGHT